MSWVTLIWSMIASACLTLAVIYLLVWRSNRAARAHLLFSVTAASTAAFAFCELWMMRAKTPEQLLAALTWGHLPLFFWLVSITWFVKTYLDAGRPWLAWTITALRTFSLLANLAFGQNPDFRAVTQVRQVEFLGETVTVLGGVPNRVTPITQLGSLLVLVFVADASLTAWRRGDRRKALMVGGSTELFLIGAIGSAMAVVWGDLQVPIGFSLFYLGVVAAMAYELTRDVIRASQLVLDLQASNKQNVELFGRLITAQEVERTRMARDLHDDFSQRVAGLSIKISSIKRNVHRAPSLPSVVDSLTSLQDDTALLADAIRRLSHELHPNQLRHIGLDAALKSFCVEFEKSHPLAITYTASQDVGPVGADTALCLYRIAQEALRNVAKHAQASHVAVTLTREADGVHLSISDDGNGFNVASSRSQGVGLGLVSMDERARLLHGTVRIETEPGRGTRVQIRIPQAHSLPPLSPAHSALRA